ncbi:MAG TPA: signal peptidase II [Candidatus Angelobacter sp.]
MNKTNLVIIVAIVGLDRLTKLLVEHRISLNSTVDVIPGFFRLTHLENPGGAFSLFAESVSNWRAPAMIAFSVAALVIISVLLWRNRQTNVMTVVLALIFGGALGNLWDRLAHGGVTDFLDFYLGSHHWYPFNIADSAIVIGTLVLTAKILAQSKKSNHKT